ncbi:MAG TPA: polysaccharide deacetylase family protein [Actinoplanes sp.]|nr:polysaccharide deacetylase family protein [Actinoplanes sp.]
MLPALSDRCGVERASRRAAPDSLPRGRHRRPESLADSTRLRPRRTAPPSRHRAPDNPPEPVATTEPVVTRHAAFIGSHRAPGTLPIESWLLAGRTRQQALLAGLVAAGLVLVMIPATAQRDTDVDPVGASGSRTVTNAPSEPAGPGAGQIPSAGRPKRQARPAAPGTAKPAEPAEPPPTSAPAAPAEEEPIIAVPPGDGPYRSLRTTGSDAVALTFDDGPDPVQTPRILALLDRYQVKATFCLVGERAQRHPDIVRRIVAAGHRLCNHTWNHNLEIGLADPEDIEADLNRTNEAIREAVPGARIPFFRAPGGNFTDRLVQVAYRDGMTSLYWEVDPRDWDHTSEPDDAAHVEQVVAKVRTSVRPGSIVLSHDYNQPDTVLAYQELLPYLTENFELGLPSAHEAPADS